MQQKIMSIRKDNKKKFDERAYNHLIDIIGNINQNLNFIIWMML